MKFNARDSTMEWMRLTGISRLNGTRMRMITSDSGILIFRPSRQTPIAMDSGAGTTGRCRT
jgi:hypothetical protein